MSETNNSPPFDIDVFAPSLTIDDLLFLGQVCGRFGSLKPLGAQLLAESERREAAPGDSRVEAATLAIPLPDDPGELAELGGDAVIALSD